MRAATQQPLVHGTRDRWLAVAVGSALFALSAAGAAGGEVGEAERSVFRAINDLPDALEPFLYVFQLCGVLLAPVVVALAAAAWGRRRLALTLVALVPLKLLVERAVVKQLIERERPGTTICGLDETCAHFRDVPLTGLSFVSGHAIITWGVAALLWPYLPGRWRWVPVAIATLNSIARIYLGAHSPLDITGGAGLGIAIGALLTIAAGTPAPTERRPDPAISRPT